MSLQKKGESDCVNRGQSLNPCLLQSLYVKLAPFDLILANGLDVIVIPVFHSLGETKGQATVRGDSPRPAK